MHKIDADSHVSNLFDSGDPSVPRRPTQVDKHWLNAVQEELMSFLTAAGIAPVKGSWSQVLASVQALFVRTSGDANQTLTGIKSFTARMILRAAGSPVFADGLRLSIEEVSASTTAFAANIYSQFGAALKMYGGRIGADVESGADGSDSGVAALVTTAAGGAYGIIARAMQTNPVRSPLHIQPQSPAPTNAQRGDLYVNAVNGKLHVYDGSSWVVVGTQT